MPGDFEERMRHLIDAAGRGTLRGEVIVDQVYAKYQELRDDLMLHGGGRHHYTRDALYDHLNEVMADYAEHLITPDGSDPHGAVKAVAERLAAGVYEYAPFEFGDLKASGHPVGYDDGATVYDRPPNVARLTEDELRAKGDLRRLGFGNQTGDAEVRRALGAHP